MIRSTVRLNSRVSLAARRMSSVKTFSSSTQSRSQQSQQQQQQKQQQQQSFVVPVLVATAAVAGVAALTDLSTKDERKVQIARAESKPPVDWDQLRADIIAILDNPKYDDGSYGPVLVRLAWHAAGTYDKATNSGGSDGATMRFAPESEHGANAGLAVARTLLEPIQARHPGISTSDLWQFAAVVAIEEMGGPKIPFRPGRVDKPDESHCTPDGRLPDAAQTQNHIRDIFYRMGFNDREIVALLGAHAIGRCHGDRSGFDGPWTKAPTMFSNEFYRELLEQKWTPRRWNGPKQYANADGDLMMLPADLALIQDEKFRVWVEKYAADEDLFFKDFAKAFQKLQENGVQAFAKPWYQFW